MSRDLFPLVGQVAGIVIGGALGVVLTHDPWLTLLPTAAGQVIGGMCGLRLMRRAGVEG